MKCPHCNTGINVEYEESETWEEEGQTGNGYQVAWAHCPNCWELIVMLQRGKYKDGHLRGVTTEEILFPKFMTRYVEPEVPEAYRQDFLEAASIMMISPKASAAVSRRLLQLVLREQFKIQHASLAHEIDAFLKLKDIPAYLAGAVDAVRNVGNFAAHPLKDTNTGEVVEVESGEAEWLLDVIEALFDFAFVQPKRLSQRKAALNKKLQSMGKPPMK
jgi:hypothetical protein